MRKLCIFIGIILLSHCVYSQEKRLALIIGNSAYEGGRALKNPVNDANLMASTLLDLGFDVIKRTDATKDEMEMAILDFWRVLASYDVNLFYYAGHGVQVNGVNYLLPVDAKVEDELSLRIEAIDVGEVVSQFERYPDNINIVVLDACRDNPFRSWMRSSSGGFVAMSAPSGTIIAYATSPGATASDGTGQYGLYTENLTQQMNIEQRIEDVFINTRNVVRESSGGRQNPQEWSQLTGSFYFKAPQVEAQETVDNNQQILQREDLPPDALTGSAEKLKYKEFGLIQGMYLNDERLRPREVRAYLRTNDSPAYSIYNKYYKQQFWGLYFSLLGIGIGGGAFIYDAVADPYPETTLAVAGFGLAIAIPGILVYFKSIGTFDRFIELYNPDPYKKVELAPTENGIGLVYRF